MYHDESVGNIKLTFSVVKLALVDVSIYINEISFCRH